MSILPVTEGRPRVQYESLPPLFDLPKVSAAVREVFPGVMPAGTAVGAHLVTRTSLVEMMITAVVP